MAPRVTAAGALLPRKSHHCLERRAVALPLRPEVVELRPRGACTRPPASVPSARGREGVEAKRAHVAHKAPRAMAPRAMAPP